MFNNNLSNEQKNIEAKNLYENETRITKEKNQLDEKYSKLIGATIIALIFFVCAFCLCVHVYPLIFK